MIQIFLYPTDTLYGLGVDATDASAVTALKELKGREEGKYFPIIVADIDMARQYAELTPLAEALAQKFWPGKLTLILKAKSLPSELIAPDGSIGIRIPNHPVALQLVRELGHPLTATSANVSGMKPMNSVSEILAQFGDKKILIYHNPAWPESLPPSGPSTVIDARGSEPVCIREGVIPMSDVVSSLSL